MLGYATVPGYLVARQSKKNKEGLPVSEVTLISDEKTREEVTKIIREKEGICNIDFW